MNRDVRIPEMYLRKIEKIIGEEVNVRDENKFLNFREVDELTKSRLREIYMKENELVADRYLKYLTSKELHKYTFVFLIEVVVDKMNLDEWIDKELNSTC